MRYTLRQLEVFVAVARQESVSRAAEALSMSQSATSTALAELEKQFDTRLFDRFGKRLQLNELSRQLLPRAIELLDRAGQIESLLTGDTGIGPLSIGASLTIGNYLATLLVGDFMRQHPGCRVQMSVHNTATIVRQVAHLEVDVGLIEGDFQHPDLEVLPWIADELVVFAAPGHPLARQDSVSMADLVAAPWILREAGSGTRQTFDYAMRHVASGLDIRLELEHTEAIKRAVESGLGIGCISRLALKERSAAAAWCRWMCRDSICNACSTLCCTSRNSVPPGSRPLLRCAVPCRKACAVATRSCCRGRMGNRFTICK